MPGHVRVGGSWKTVSSPSVKVGGSWKSVDAGFTKVGGAWKQWYTASTPGVFELLETYTVSSPQGTVSFSNINSTYGSTYQHLQLRMSVRTTRALNNDQLIITFNGDTSNAYAYHELYRTSGNMSDYGLANQSEIRIRNIQTAQNATGYTGVVMYLADPFESGKNRTVRWQSGAGAMGNVMVGSGFRNSTEAVNTITIDAIGDLDQYSRFSLYGIRAANV